MGSAFEFMPEPSDENPCGFFENVKFRNVNDRILKNVRYDVKSWKTPIPTCKDTKQLRNEIRGVLEGYTGGVKDPRFSLTWPIWKPYLPKDTTTYLIFRNPSAVAKSLLKRGNTKNMEQGYALWNEYNKRALAIREHFNTTVVQYEDILVTPELVTPDFNNLIDRTLQHNEPQDIPNICKPVWNSLYSCRKTQP